MWKLLKKKFNTENNIIDEEVDLKQLFEVNVKDCIFHALSESSDTDSGWALNEILNLYVTLNKYQIGNGISTYIKLPEKIGKSKLALMFKIFTMRNVLLGL